MRGGVAALAVALPAGVDEEGGVEVAVTDVAEVDNRHGVLGAEPLHRGHELGDAVAGDDDVLVDLADHHRRHRRADRLARRPEPLLTRTVDSVLDARR